VSFANQKCDYLDLVIFERRESEHQKPKSELMFDFTFSGSYPKKNYKDQFFEVELNT
jgi:hypothetical protein